jgi:hypothetical protein
VVRNDGQHDLQRLFCDWAEILKAKSRSKDLVESRSGAVTVIPFRFQIPLIKPDVQICERCRLQSHPPRPHADRRELISNRISESIELAS